MTRILAIVGARKDGNTDEILKYFESLLPQDRFNLEKVFLEDESLDYCTGCHNCFSIGEHACPHSSDVQRIESRITGADVVILASPGYMFSVTGRMKSFLDHVAYNCHRPRYFGKRIFYISACTKWQEKSVFTPMQTWGSASGFESLGSLYVEMLPFPLAHKELDKRRKKIQKSVSSFIAQCSKPVRLKPDFASLMVFRAFRTLCNIAPKILKPDLEYFRRIGAYEKGRSWYMNDVRVNPVMNGLAAFAEGQMEKAIGKMVDMDSLDGARGFWKNRL